MSGAGLVLTRDRGIARVALNRPEKRNAITAEMWEQLAQEVVDSAADQDVRALVIQGEGGCFTAGADLASVRDADGKLSESFHEKAFSALAELRRFPKPVVALIDGPCVGAGISIAMSCDIRLATSAAMLAVPAVSLGIVYEEWAVSRLVELIGSGQTSRFLLTGARVSGREAADLGLVERCVDDLDSEGSAVVEALIGADPDSLAATKRTIRRVAGPHDLERQKRS